MKKILGLICLAAALVITAFSASAQNGRAARKIQIISSYGYDDAWGQQLCSKVTFYAKKIIPGATVSIVNTDIVHIKTFAGCQREMADAIEHEGETPDAIVILGTEGWMVLKEMKLQINIPIVVCAATDQTMRNYSYFLRSGNVPDSLKSTLKDETAGYNVTGVFGKDNLEATYMALKVILPKNNSVLYFSEGTFADYLNSEEFEDLLTPRNITFASTDVKKINMDFLNTALSNLTKPNTTIIINSFSTDNYSGYNSVYNAQNIPIVMLREIPADETTPMIGGIFVSVPKLAAATAATLRQIFEGTPASAIQYKYISPEKLAVNKVAADRLGIRIAGNKYNIMYEDHTGFFAKFLSKILLAVLIILLLLAAAINLLVRSRNKKVAEDSELYSKLLRDYSMLFKNSPVGIAIFSGNGQFMEGNPKADEELSMVIPSYKNKGNFSLLSSPYVSDATLQKIKRKEVADKHFIFKVNDNNIYQRVIFIPAGVDGKDAVVLLIVNNTDEYLARAEKDKINTSFLLAMDASKYGVAKFDITKPEYAYIGTDSWFHNLKIKNGTSLGESFNSLIKEDLAAVLRFSDQVKNNTVNSFSKDVRTKNEDGTIHWLHLSIVASNANKNEDGIICFAIISDIDQQTKTSMEQAEKRDKYIESTKLRNSLISNLGNELKTPLNALIGFAELLVEATPSDDKAELQKYIEENSEKFLQMVNDIINVSEIESHSAYSDMAEFNLEEVFEKTAEERSAKAKNGNIKIEFEKQGNSIIFSDKSRITNILQLLCNNAETFIGPSKNGTIRIGYEMRENNIYMFVSDTGTSVSGEKRARLFDRLDHLEDESYVDQGLDLPISRSLVRSLHGEIGYKQGDGGSGNTIWCIIPKNYAAESNDATIKGALENATVQKDKGQKIILVAEDNQNNFQLLNFILRKEYIVLHAHDGEEAVKMTAEKKPNVVLMDIKMPKLDGFQATEKIRKSDTVTPIIAVTAYTSEKSQTQVREGQFNGYISKPVNEVELRRALERVLSDGKNKEEKK